jgi:tripartite-type tricarboxylate transporter receptor subunit TctC
MKNLCVLIIALATSLALQAKDFIMVLPYGASGGLAKVIREFVPLLEKQLGESIITEFRPGTGAKIATQYLDDLTRRNQPAVMISFLSTLTGGDLDPSLQPFSYFGTTTFYMFSKNVSKVPELLRQLETCQYKGKPLTVSGQVALSPPHFVIESLSEECRKQFLYVPYQSAGQAFGDMIGGHVDISIVAWPMGGEFVRSGQAQIIASIGVTKSASLKDIPRYRAKDFDGQPDINSLIFLNNRAADPKQIERFQQALDRVYATTEFREMLHRNDWTRPGPAESFDLWFQEEFKRLRVNGQLIKSRI